MPVLLLVLSLLLNLVLLTPTIIRHMLHVPAPDNGSFVYVSAQPTFLTATIDALAQMGEQPICTAHSPPNLKRYLYPDGDIFNCELDDAFMRDLGNPAAVRVYVSDDPEADAYTLAALYTGHGSKAKVVEHNAPEMKGKMFFVSFADSSYNPGWCFAYRLTGRKLPQTEPWKPGA